MLSKLVIYLILQLKVNVFFLMKFDKFEMIFNHWSFLWNISDFIILAFKELYWN